MRPLRVAVIVNVVPHYRLRFWELVHERKEIEVTLFCQTKRPNSGLKLVHDQVPQTVVPIEVWGPEEYLAWQRLPLNCLRKDYDVTFWMANPRLVSCVVWTMVLSGLGRPVVLGSQAHSVGSKPWTEALRLGWWRRFSHLVVYNDNEEKYLRERGFVRQFIRGLNNGLDQKAIDSIVKEWTRDRLDQFATDQDLNGRTVTASLGRIHQGQRLSLLIEGLPALVEQYPELLHIVIGDGPLRSSHEALAKKLGVENNIRWLGAIFDEEELAPWLLSSTLLVHPGAIGLSLNHAFGYGLPVVTHSNRRRHGSEICALEDGTTGAMFPEGDVPALVDAVSALLSAPDRIEAMGQAALEQVRTHYNVDVMVDRFTETVLAAHAAPN